MTNKFIAKRVSVPDYAVSILIFRYYLSDVEGMRARAVVLNEEWNKFEEVAWMRDLTDDDWELSDLENAMQDFEDYYVNLGYAVFRNHERRTNVG